MLEEDCAGLVSRHQQSKQGQGGEGRKRRAGNNKNEINSKEQLQF